MRISRLRLRNWRNFRDAEISDLPDIVYALGPNASGKSNLLDALRFLGDVAKPVGGGLQQAVEKRGGMGKIRCFHARRKADVEIEVDISSDNGKRLWTYSLSFNSRQNDPNTAFVMRESVTKHPGQQKEEPILERLHNRKRHVSDELLQTHLEQAAANRGFRNLGRYLAGIKYFHLVPQLLKFNGQIGGIALEDDPFGQDFINRISLEDHRVVSDRLGRVERLLKLAIPYLDQLRLVKDEHTGKPHLEFRFLQQKPHGAAHWEDQLSDGTLRLIAILWSCYEASGHPILIEDPELSLNDGIMRGLHSFFKKSLGESKKGGQFFISTHNGALLSNPGISARAFAIIMASGEGSAARKANKEELDLIQSGFSAADAILTGIERQSGGIWKGER